MRVWKTVYLSLARSLSSNDFTVAARVHRVMTGSYRPLCRVSPGTDTVPMRAATSPLSITPEDSEAARAREFGFYEPPVMPLYGFFVIGASLRPSPWNYGDCFVVSSRGLSASRVR